MNFSLVVNSAFKPFTYQELTAPLDRMEQAHDMLESEYDKLSAQTDVLEAMGKDDRDKNSPVYNQYKNFSDSIIAERDNLYQHGLDYPNSRSRLSNLYRRYNSEIIPIHNAWNKREKELQIQTAARIQNPYIRFTRDADKTSLQEYLDNPNSTYGVVNLQNVANDMKTMATTLSKQIKSGATIEGIDPYTYAYIRKWGLDENIINRWIQNPETNATLTNMMYQSLAKNGATKEALAGSVNMNSIMNEAIMAAQSGAWHAIGTDTIQAMDNFEAREGYKQQVALQKKLAEDQQYRDGLLGETVPLSYNDPEFAGASMRRKMAKETRRAIEEEAKRGTRSSYQQIVDKWKDKGGMDAAEKYWAENGVDVEDLSRGDKEVYFYLRNAIRKNVTKNENLIEMWTRKDAVYSDDYNEEDYVQAYSPSITGAYVEHRTHSPKLKYTIDWDRYNKEASKGFYIDVVDVQEDQEQLKKYLRKVVSRSGRDGKVDLYDLKGIAGDGSYKYSDSRTSIDDLPKNSSGELDFSNVHRVFLSNGDFMLHWLNDDGDSVKKILKRSSIGKDSENDWAVYKRIVEKADGMLKDNKITKDEYDQVCREALIDLHYKDVEAIRKYNVKDESI